METRSHESVTVILEGQDLGCGTLTICQEELIWTASSADLLFKLHYTSISKYGIFPSCPVDNWREGLTVIGNLDGQAVEKTVVLLLDEALTTVLDMLIDRVDVGPTIEASLKPHVTKISTSTLSTSILRTHVTCLEFIGELLFAGIGDTLHVFSRNESEWTRLMSHQIFQGQNIYGIKGNGKHLVTYGGKSVCSLRYKFALGVSQVKLIHNFTVGGWVLDCIWLNGGTSIAVLTANNAVVSYDLRICDIVKSSTIYCSERCILYSGKLLGTNWADIIVLAGTVFSTIMIWKNTEDCNVVNVIHELEGHKGVIFSVTFCEKTHRICSTSDDRTVRVWDVEFKNSYSLDWTNCSVSLKFSLYGHSARVWKSHFLGNGKVVSVGEDSQICLWNNDGTLDNQWSGHQGGEIWSLAVSETLQLIATGGSDSGISLWPVASAPLPHILALGSSTMENTPRCVGLTQNGSPFMVNSNGDILLHTKGSWNCVMSDSRFSSYCLHSVNPTRTMVAFGSITGFVLICRFELNSISKLLETAVCDGRIFSVIWLSDDSLATCATDGVFSIWNVSHHFQTLERISTFVLPHSKERWITSCAVNEQYLVCGDRLGSLFLYSKLGNENPIFCAKRIHGHNGVTDVKLIDEHVFSTGRDGKYREFVIEKGELVLLRCCKLKLDWAAAIAETELLNKLLLCFHGVFFVIWSVHERRTILKIDCGGGHRSWDCLVDSVNGNINLTYIKGKSVFYFCVPVRDVISHTVVPGGHPKAINAAAIVPLLHKCSDSHYDGQLVILGGEDTTLRLVSLGTKSETLLSVLQSHLSSIRSVVCQRSNFHDTVYVVSGGGRGQLVVWRILHSVTRSMLEMIELTSHCVIETPNKNQKVTHDSAEMRIMDLELYQNSSGILTICAACSDGLLRIFNYDIHNNTVSHLQDVIRGHCLLKVLHVEWGFPFIVSACTSGLLVFHNISKGEIEHCEMVNSYSASDSGINSCDYKLTEDFFVLSCAGDDAHVNIIAFTRNNEKFNVKSHWKNTTAHTCQVSGLIMAENWLFSAGLDRTLAVFTWKLSGGELVASLVDRLNLCVPDVHGTLVWRRDGDDKITVFVHGLGTQLLTFSCDG